MNQDSSAAHATAPLRIAVIIPILNEAQTLPRTLQSLACQDYPLSSLEVIIVDGGSTDGWREAVDAVELGPARVTILQNDRRVTPAAVNLALRSTDAPAVLWVSGHCTLASDYISALAAEFVRHENVAVGGRLLVHGEGISGVLNELVLRSPIGTGMAPWRWSTVAGWTSRVNFALFDRQTLLDLGGLDERLHRNQDNDLMRRLEDHGVRFYQVMSTVSYLAPSKLSGLWKRAWGNASWTIWCWKLGIPSAQWYHTVPMAAIVILVALLAAAFVSTIPLYVALGLIVCYAVLIGVHTVTVSIAQRRLWAIPLLPFHLAAFHAIYGMGSWVALLRPVPATDDSKLV